MSTQHENPFQSSAAHLMQQPSSMQTPDAQSRPAIVTHDLLRVFGQKAAVNYLNLTVQRGEFLASSAPTALANPPPSK